MSDDVTRLRKALAKIAEVASAAATHADGEPDDADCDHHPPAEGTYPCTPKFVPERLLVKAAKNAVAINPFNQPELGPLHLAAPDLEVTELFITVQTATYWGATPAP